MASLPWFCCLFVSFGMTQVYADGATPEHDLLGVLENEMIRPDDAEEPNSVNDRQVSENTPPDVPKSANTAIHRENDLFITGNPTSPIQRQLWKARISNSGKPGIDSSKVELERVIRQINAIEIKPRVQAAAPAAVETVIKPEPVQAAAPVQETKSPTVEPSKNVPADGVVSEKTLQRFKDKSQQPELLINPLELAEILYKSHCLDEAAACYQEALNRLNAAASEEGDDKAWILLQLGHCLEKKNPQAALEKYQLIIAEFPYSSWASLAKSKSDLIDWYLKDQPNVLINTVQSAQ